MLYDCRGLAVTTEEEQAIERLDAATYAFLAQRPDVRALLGQALVADPGLAVGHVLDGFCHLLAARRPALDAARQALMRARQAVATRGATARELHLTDALAAWAVDGDMVRAADLLDEAVGLCGLDVLSLRLGHAVRFMLGDVAAMRRSLEAALRGWSPDVPDYSFVLGCHAFALGETGEIARAEAVGRMAVGLCPDDLWGGHAVAHALGGQRRQREAVAWITWMEPHMACGGSFVRHVTWHRALGHLALGEGHVALELYRAMVSRGGLDEVRDMLNAASLLWRLQDAGQPVHQWMWDELADVAEQRIGEHAWVFADLHYVLSLAGAGRMEALAGMLGSMRRHGDATPGTQARITAEVGLPAARAIAAAARGAHVEAAELLRAAEPSFARVGGSIVQRSLLRRIRDRSEVLRELHAS